jgi:hypothetical protein
MEILITKDGNSNGRMLIILILEMVKNMNMSKDQKIAKT